MNRRKVLSETLPVLFLCALGGSLTGYILGNMTSALELIPGLIAIIPAIIGMRGNISSAMGARLGSAVHLGLVDKGVTSEIAKENLKSSMSLSLFVSTIIPILYALTSLIFPVSFETIIVISIFIISILTGLTSGLLLSFLAFFIVTISIKFDIDPDNITGPLLTTIGDVITLSILFSYSLLIGGVLF